MAAAAAGVVPAAPRREMIAERAMRVAGAREG